MRHSHEHSARSVAKAISWRVIATLDTILIAYLLTGDLRAATAIGTAEIATKFFIYLAHERLWARVKVGLKVARVPAR